MASYDQVQKKLSNLERDCLAAITELQVIMSIFTEFQIDKLSGIDLNFKKSVNPTGSVRPVDQAIVDIKIKIKNVTRRYSRLFPAEFKFIDAPKLADFNCLPAPSVLGSVELKTAVNKTLESMGKKLGSIQDKKRELNQESFSGPTKNKAFASFFSFENSKLLDSVSTVKGILSDYWSAQKTEDTKIKKETNEGVQSTLDGDSSTSKNLWDTLGMESVPAPKVVKKVGDFYEHLRSLQYPKSLRYCDDRRNVLDVSTLQSSRMGNADHTNEQGKEATKQSDAHGKGYGRAYLQTVEFKRLDRIMQLKLVPALASNSSTSYAQNKAKYDNLVQSIEASDKRSSVRIYIAEIRSMTHDLDRRG